MTSIRNKLLILAALFLGGFITGNTFAASDSIKEGGIGGTGSPAMRGGIGGTGAPANSKGIGGTGSPAMRGGIGGTGLRPNDEPVIQALAGKVLFVVGQVEAQNLGQTRSLAKGDSVRVGDTLKSSKGATLQLRMEDGGTIVLRPDSQLAINSFSYKGVQDGSEHLELALLTGGFRAVTGEIGHLHKENYSIRTPNAQVGILGTDHETVFVPQAPAGQANTLESGTYNHVISGATLLQDKQGKLLIKPSQTGFAALNGANPVIIAKPLPIFGEQKSNLGTERNGDMGDTVRERNENADSNGHGSSDSGSIEHGSGEHGSNEHGSNGQRSGAEQNSKGGNITIGGATGSMSDAGQTFGGSMSVAEQNHVTQVDHIANTNLDINTLDKDALPATSGSAVVGAHMVAGVPTVGSVLTGNPEETLYIDMDDAMPSSYSNRTSGFNYVSNEADMVDYGRAQVDNVKVKWGVYAGGMTFDTSGKSIPVNFHPFVYADAGATPPAVIAAISGNATFSNMIGNTKPITELGNLGGSVVLNVGINFSAATLTSYNLAVTDSSSRNWTGTLNNGPVTLSTFAQNGTSLAVSCGGCGSGAASGSAVGTLIGPNAKGLISSYVMSTTTGQAVAGAAIISRP